MASNDNDKHKLEEEAKSLMVRKRLRLSDNDGGNEDSSDLPEETEEVPSKQSLMNQLDTFEEKL
jgi:hypothetical protein